MAANKPALLRRRWSSSASLKTRMVPSLQHDGPFTSPEAIRLPVAAQ